MYAGGGEDFGRHHAGIDAYAVVGTSAGADLAAVKFELAVTPHVDRRCAGRRNDAHLLGRIVAQMIDRSLLLPTLTQELCHQCHQEEGGGRPDIACFACSSLNAVVTLVTLVTSACTQA